MIQQLSPALATLISYLCLQRFDNEYLRRPGWQGVLSLLMTLEQMLRLKVKA